MQYKFQDLNAVFSCNLDFNKLLENIRLRVKAYEMLGFIYRSTDEINDGVVLLHFQKFLVCPKLSCKAVVWSPCESMDCKLLESVQNRFLKLLPFRSGSLMRYNEHGYTPIARKLNVPNQQSVRDIYDTCCTYKIFNKDLPCRDRRSQFVQRW